MFKKILVPIDIGQTGGRSATIEIARDLAKAHGSLVVFLNVVERVPGYVAAQMTAMDNATKNAGDLIEELTRELNKARQSSITLELMDIIGGAEAVAQ